MAAPHVYVPCPLISSLCENTANGRDERQQADRVADLQQWSNFQPPACGTATLSGQYSYNATGFMLARTAQNGASEETGILQFDGQGNVTSSFMLTSGTSAASPATGSGTYTVAGCLASATLTDSTGKQNSMNFAIAGNYGETLDLIAANSQFIRAGAAHSTLTNPTQAIG